MRFIRILPELWARTSWPLASSTLNVAFFSASLTVPSSTMASSFLLGRTIPFSAGTALDPTVGRPCFFPGTVPRTLGGAHGSRAPVASGRSPPPRRTGRVLFNEPNDRGDAQVMRGEGRPVAGEPGTAGDVRGEGYKWVALSNTTVGVLLATIDSSIMLIAMPDIFRGVRLNPLSPGNSFYLLWMILGFLIVSSVLVVSLGRLGDLFGRVRMYNLGFVVYTAASLVLTIDPL